MFVNLNQILCICGLSAIFVCAEVEVNTPPVAQGKTEGFFQGGNIAVVPGLFPQSAFATNTQAKNLNNANQVAAVNNFHSNHANQNANNNALKKDIVVSNQHANQNFNDDGANDAFSQANTFNNQRASANANGVVNHGAPFFAFRRLDETTTGVSGVNPSTEGFGGGIGLNSAALSASGAFPGFFQQADKRTSAVAGANQFNQANNIRAVNANKNADNNLYRNIVVSNHQNANANTNNLAGGHAVSQSNVLHDQDAKQRQFASANGGLLW